MLIRFFAGLIHPLIHTGLGVEFGLPGTFAEGAKHTLNVMISIYTFHVL